MNVGEQHLERVRAAIRENSDLVAITLADLIVALGARREWSMEDNFQTTEIVAGLSEEVGLPSAGTADTLEFYAAAAQARGLRYDTADDPQ